MASICMYFAKKQEKLPEKKSKAELFAKPNVTLPVKDNESDIYIYIYILYIILTLCNVNLT